MDYLPQHSRTCASAYAIHGQSRSHCRNRTPTREISFSYGQEVLVPQPSYSPHQIQRGNIQTSEGRWKLHRNWLGKSEPLRLSRSRNPQSHTRTDTHSQFPVQSQKTGHCRRTARSNGDTWVSENTQSCWTFKTSSACNGNPQSVSRSPARSTSLLPPSRAGFGNGERWHGACRQGLRPRQKSQRPGSTVPSLSPLNIFGSNSMKSKAQTQTQGQIQSNLLLLLLCKLHHKPGSSVRGQKRSVLSKKPNKALSCEHRNGAFSPAKTATAFVPYGLGMAGGQEFCCVGFNSTLYMPSHEIRQHRLNTAQSFRPETRSPKSPSRSSNFVGPFEIQSQTCISAALNAHKERNKPLVHEEASQTLPSLIAPSFAFRPAPSVSEPKKKRVIVLQKQAPFAGVDIRNPVSSVNLNANPSAQPGL